MIVERPREIPAAAVLRSEFSDRTDVVAVDPGTAWVVDSSNRILYSGRLQKGDTLTVEPAGNQIVVNGRRTYDGTLTAGHYRVFFEKSPR